MNTLSSRVRSIPALAAVCACLTTSALAADSVQLFNGQNLRGWHAYLSKHGVTKRDVWSVQDGLLVCKGDPMGYMYTAQQFESFKLAVEWRWAPGKEAGNNGVLMRINGEPRPLPRCLEAQLQSGNAGDLYGFHGMAIDGDAARKIERDGGTLAGQFRGVKKIEGNENPVGEWNRYEIILDGEKLTVSVNGKKVNEAIGCEVLSGPLGLQSEGGEIHFRKIDLTPIE